MKKVLLILGGAALTLALTVVVIVLTFDINSYRPRIEAASSRATGLEVRINGKIGLSLFPFGISARDIHIANKGGEILSLETLRVGAELMPLLRKQLKVTRCELVRPVFTIVKEVDGKFNFEINDEKSTEGAPGGTTFRLNDLKLIKGALVYIDRRSGQKTEFKDLSFALKDLSIARNVIRSASFSGSMDCREILQKGFRIEKLKSSVTAVRGIYTFEPLTIATLDYTGRKAGEKTTLKEIKLAIKDLSVVDASGAVIKNIAFTGNFNCREIRKKNLRIDNVASPVRVGKGVVTLSSLTMDIFGTRAEADATVDRSEADAVYTINLKAAKLDFERLQESFGAKKMIGGKGDLNASLTMREKGDRGLMSGMEGRFSLRGYGLVTYTMDLDKVLSSYETSQQFNLVDIGAFFIAGPLSTVALKGYRYGDLYIQSREGQGVIQQLNSDWKIKDGIADATDCALATRHNRVALTGRLDLVREQYDGIIVALLDDKGCAKFRQGVSGPFGSPHVGALSAVETIAGPISNLFRKAKRVIQGGRCEVFYHGAVPQPR